MALQPHTALAEIRDTLLETYASNEAMNQLILSHLDPRAWRAQPPGQKGNGRTIAAIFAHLHNNRLVWLKNSAPHLKCPPPLDPDRCTMRQAAAAHRKAPFSACACCRMLSRLLRIAAFQSSLAAVGRKHGPPEGPCSLTCSRTRRIIAVRF